jgi:23S rRNA (uracil1939-C5)-methyltransferase
VTLDIDDQRSSALVNQRQPFRQANDEQNATMSRWLGRTLESLASPDGLLELFCGSGNLTSVLADTFPDHQITAVEGDEDALEELLSLELPNVRTQWRNLFSAMDIKTLAATLPGSHGIVLDPPRDGLKERQAFTSVFSASPWVVYLSCNLATWQRDAHFLREHGLVLTQVEGLDMFPQTPHLEVLSVFERK